MPILDAGSAPTIDAGVTNVVTDDARTFGELGVPEPLVGALRRMGIEHPLPIQSASLPDSLGGRDVLGRGRTGSGKTLAFALPTVAALMRSTIDRQPRRPRALILVPTRELATQVAATFAPLAEAAELRVTTIYGGVGQNPQVAALSRGVDIVVACPGRLEDLIAQRHCRLDAVEVTVLDEADHMADLGFLPVVRRLLDATPTSGQRLLFSATLDNGVGLLVNRYMHDPVTRAVDPPVAPVTTMVHHFLHVSSGDKAELVSTLASGTGRSLLFTRTKHAAKKLAAQLTKSGIPAADLQGNLSQNARERNLAAFASGEIRVLVATDIAARGIHVDDVELVVHVDPPAEHKAFLHRSGRTARAGASGTVITVITPDQQRDARALARDAGIKPQITAVTPHHELVEELVGDRAPFVEWTPPPVPAPRPPRGPSSNGRANPAPSGRRPRNGRPGRPARNGRRNGS